VIVGTVIGLYGLRIGPIDDGKVLREDVDIIWYDIIWYDMTGEIYMIITGGYKYIDLLFHNEKLWAQRVVWKSITEIIENTGLGKDTALKLVSLGANVIILCKSVEKAKNTIADIENNNKIGIQYNTIQYNQQEWCETMQYAVGLIWLELCGEDCCDITIFFLSLSISIYLKLMFW